MATQSIVFVDSRVSNYQSLIDSLTEPAEVFVLGGESDGLAQMAAGLKGRSGIDAIHVISHGSVGALYLGSTVLDGGNLANYQSQLASIGSALTETGDILLYGCNVAQGDVGVQFIGNLAQATGADVAGSSDATGAEALGGDWVLEVTFGSPTQASLLPAAYAYEGLLIAESEPNNSSATANPMTVGTQMNGAIQIESDLDFYSVVLNGTGILTVAFDSPIDIAYTIPHFAISVFDSNGLLLANQETSIDRTFQVGANAAGTYYVGVSRGSSSLYDTGTYGLTLSAVAGNTANYESEGNNTLATADAATLSTAISGQVASATDHDYFRVVLDGTGLLNVAFDSPIDVDYSISHFAISVFDSNGLLLANQETSIDRTFQVGVNSAGTYYVEISRGSSSLYETGMYGLTLGAVAGNTANYESESNGTLATADLVATATSISGQLASDSDVDAFRFSAETAGYVEILFAPPTQSSIFLDSQHKYYFNVSVLNQAGTLLANYETSGASSFIVGLQNAGDYVVAVSSAQLFDSRTYVVSATPVEGDAQHFESENNSTRAQADSVSLNSVIYGQIYGPTDHDYYSVALGASGILSMVFDSPVNIDLSVPLFAVSVFDSSGLLLANHEISNDRTLQVGVNAAGTYYIEVSSANLYDTGMYGLTFSAVAGSTANYESESNNTLATADVATLGTTTSGQVASATDLDYYSVVLDKTGLLTVAFDSPNSIDYSSSYFAISVLDSNGLLLANQETSIDRTFQVGVNTAGTYYVGVSRGSSSLYETRMYGLTLSAVAGNTANYESESNNTLATADVATLGTTMSGQVASATDHDYYSVVLDKTGLLTVAFDSPNNFDYSSSRFTISVFDSSGLLLASQQTNIDRTFQVDVSAAGTYYVEVSRGASSLYETGMYGLTLSQVNSAPTGLVTIGGNATQGQTLTAVNTLADIDGLGTMTYQWKANGTAIAGATSSTLVLAEAQVGMTITATASYTDGHGTAESKTSSASTAIANVNDPATGAVTITGTPTQGQTLTASNTLADLDGLGTISYQWKANGTAIAGATSSTLILAAAQVGKTITVTASYTDGHGTIEAVTSNASAAVANVNDLPTGGVTITGTLTQGQTLTAANNLLDPDGLGTVAYQWNANGEPIAGGTGNVFTLTEAQVGKAITVVASYVDGHGTSESVSSTVSTTVANVNDPATGAVTITGTPTQGQTLTASNTLADLDGLGTISYQWKANGTSIAGATTSTLTLTEAQVGKAITVTASYTDGHGAAETVTSNASAAVANVNDLPTGGVTIIGTLTQGQTLASSNNLLDSDGLGTVAYQWKANGEPIVGGTGNVFTLTEAQVGRAITVVASYVDGHGTSESVSSTVSTTVANVNDLPTGAVTIAGTATQGQTLTATNTLADLDGLGTISYQWQASGVDIAGATSSTLLLGQAQVSKAITAVARYTDAQGTIESVASTATVAIANVNDAPTGSVSISGPPMLGQELTAANTLGDQDGLGTVTYQWSAGGVAISGAINSTLILTEAQVGKTITVTASYTDGHGAAESLRSAPTAAVSDLPPVNFMGTKENDTFTGTARNDTIDGSFGTDTAVYTARSAAYSLAANANGYSIDGPDGVDSLVSIERLQFLDANLAFDLDGNAGQTYRLYQASFNRTPDLGGLGGWIAAMDAGTTPTQVATSFMASAEFQSLYGANPTNEQFVALLYTNALHRTADAGGLAYWVNQLVSGLQTRAQALVNLAESAENKASVLPAIGKGIVFANAAQAAGPSKGQSMTGTSGADSLIGTVSNDTLTGGAGNDTINGGGGLDTAVYGGARASYSAANTNAVLTVSGGADATDTLANVERLKFEDTILAFDTNGNAGQTYRLYQAAFNRTPDKDGLSGWVKGVDQGLSMLKVAAAFIDSGEFKALYGNSPTDTTFVNLLYTNALHRTADAGGLEYWVNQLGSHAQSREQALLGFAESAENQAALIGVIQGGIELALG